jgi:hypothetical protein
LNLYECPVCKTKNEEQKNYCVQCGSWLLSDRFPAQKAKKRKASDRLYICSFCDTANEAGRNACKKCFKPLFSTEYETKELTVNRIGLASKVLRFFMYLLSVITVLIALLAFTSETNNKVLLIPVTIMLLSLIQFIFGLINPAIIPGKIRSRGKVFATYSISIIVLFIVSGIMSQSSNKAPNAPASVTTPVEVAPSLKIAPAPAATPVESTSSANEKESAEQYKNSSKKIPYIDIARNPDKFKGEQVTFEGQVIQVLESGNNVGLRVNVTKGKYDTWQDTVFINYRRQNGEDRILDKDVISLWGVVKGLKTYKTVLNSETSLPEIDAKYVSITSK